MYEVLLLVVKVVFYELVDVYEVEGGGGTMLQTVLLLLRLTKMYHLK